MSATLGSLAAVGGVELAPQWRDLLIEDVCDDSREVCSDSLFAAIRGYNTDGHRYAPAAIKAGARALLVEQPLGLGVPELVVESVRHVLGPLAAAVHNYPSKHLNLVGVTGTNGKTTTVHILASLLRSLGESVVTIGTLTHPLTTPTAATLQRELAQSVARGVSVVAAEVSSHALAQQRVTGCRFKVVAFTNLGVDHLDYHTTMEDYFTAKCKLFEPEFANRAVVNVGCRYGVRLADKVQLPLTRIGAHSVQDVCTNTVGSTFRWRNQRVSLPIPGEFNISNAVLAAEIAFALGYQSAEIAHGLAEVPVVPGRFEMIDEGQPFLVVVDYAHTPEALAAVLQTARALSHNSVLVVFGAGGNRHHDKRPQMGRVVQQYADWIAVTSDNPRAEPNQKIAEAIVSGMTRKPDLVEHDRHKAISAAIEQAREGDVVLIAGKGHEAAQIIGSCRQCFDDREVARHYLHQRVATHT